MCCFGFVVDVDYMGLFGVVKMGEVMVGYLNLYWVMFVLGGCFKGCGIIVLCF